MERKAVSGTISVLLLISMSKLAFNIQPVRAEPTTWTVDDDGPADLHTIQEAINAANLIGSIALVSAEDSTTVSIQPFPHNLDYFVHNIGETVEFTLYVHDVSNLYAWQSGLRFNPNVLQAISFTEGTFLAQSGVPTLWLSGAIDNLQGIIEYSTCSLTEPGPGVSGSGDLAYITFEIFGYGYSGLELTTLDGDETELILIDSELIEIPGDTSNGHFGYVILGDIEGDGDVDSYDLYLFAGAYGSSIGDAAYNPNADLDMDSDVDSDDFYIFAGNYGKST